MTFNCLFCGNQIFLNHKIFFNDENALQCSRCGATVDIPIKTKKLTLVRSKNASYPAPISEVPSSH
jgi:transcription elongation factor Elf1